MELRAIKSKFNNGRINNAAVVRKRESRILGGHFYFVVIFFDGQQQIELTRQRGGIRPFVELYSAANVIEKVGLKNFLVTL